MNMVSAEPSSPDEALASMRNMAEVVELLHCMPKLTMAAANGPCAGAGLSLAAACDMRIAARSAVFLTSYIEVGQSGDYGQAWFLERLIGAGWTARLQLLSERIDSEMAVRIGLVEEVVDGAQVTQQRQNTHESMCYWSQCTQSCSVSGGDSNNRVSDTMRFSG